MAWKYYNDGMIDLLTQVAFVTIYIPYHVKEQVEYFRLMFYLSREILLEIRPMLRRGDRRTQTEERERETSIVEGVGRQSKACVIGRCVGSLCLPGHP
jgi:hypothetical protein